MAEAVLFGIAQEIITKLGSQGIQEIGQWWGFKDELDKLNTTVSSIKAVLLDAEERVWLSRYQILQKKPLYIGLPS